MYIISSLYSYKDNRLSLTCGLLTKVNMLMCLISKPTFLIYHPCEYYNLQHLLFAAIKQQSAPRLFRRMGAIFPACILQLHLVSLSTISALNIFRALKHVQQHRWDQRLFLFISPSCQFLLPDVNFMSQFFTFDKTSESLPMFWH